MDLSTVQEKLDAGKYVSVDDFSKDVTLIWSNAMAYNRPDSDIWKNAEKFDKLFAKKIAKVKADGSTLQRSGTKKMSEKEVTKQERIKLSQLVNQLDATGLEKLVAKIQRDCPHVLATEGEDNYEISINSIDSQSLSSLNSFCQKLTSKP